MKIAFFGNTKYSVIDTRILNKKFGLSLIVTKADKLFGRKRVLTANPVKQFALEKKIPLIVTDKLDKESIEKIKKYSLDFLVVADYGLIIPSEILGMPKYAPLNVHHSLLPKYRGPSPAPSTILAGKKISGVTIIKMTDDVDAGNILAQQKYRLAKDETTDSLLTKLNEIGAKLAIKLIDRFSQQTDQGATLVQGRTLIGKPQDENLATFTKRFEKTDGHIDIEKPPTKEVLDRMIRAFYPWPGVWTEIKLKVENGELKILKIKFLPGEKIQPEGKRPMTLKEFKNGYPGLSKFIENLF